MIELLNDCGRRWYEFFGLMLAQNTLFLGLIFALLYWMREAPARVRHLVTLVGVVKLISPPFVPLSVSSSAAYLQLPALTSIPNQPIVASAGTAVAGASSLTPAALLFSAWLAVAAGIVIRTLIATVGFRLSLRDAREVDDADTRAWARRNGIRLFMSDRVPVPMTIGLSPRVVFVPPHWSSWTPTVRQAVLRHEMAHIHRRDGLTRTLETTVRALYWFHPLVWLLNRSADAYREQACDEIAAASDPVSRLAYSRQLVGIAEHLLDHSGVHASASALMRRRNELLDRVHYLTKGDSTMHLSRMKAVVLSLALAIAIASLSWYHSAATPPPPPEKHARVELALAGDGGITIDGAKVELQGLEKALQERAGQKDLIVQLVCADDLPMSTLFQVHKLLRAGDLRKVQYSGLEGKALPLMLPNDKMIQTAKSLPAEDIVLLVVAAGDECSINGMKVKPSKIHKVVAKHLSENEMLLVSLRMAPEASYAQYVHALEQLERAQAKRIFIQEPGAL